MIGDFESFRKELSLSQTEICRGLYRQNPDLIRIKKEYVAVRNLARIIDSTLRLTSRKGFHAMSLRDLSADTGLSIGGLYAYIRSKEDLVYLIQSHGFQLTRRTMLAHTRGVQDPRERLHAGVKAHVYLSELLQPWFYFSFMEAKSFPAHLKKEAIAVELEIEAILRDIIADGIARGTFRQIDARMLAALCKAMMQDWYLKRRKYSNYQADATDYADFIAGVLDRYLLP